MHEVLYAPGLGYYTAGLRKLARRSTHGQAVPDADFVTAPELSVTFGQTLAQQIFQVMRNEGLKRIIEFGPGTGQLACDILDELAHLGLHDVQYELIEVSDDLKAQQAETFQKHGYTAHWLDTIPDRFEGIIVANEVLDAMPVHLLGWADDETVFQRGVDWDGQQFIWSDRPAPQALAEQLASCMPPLPGYVTEVCPQAQAWIRTLASHLHKGLILLIDYGFTQSEYYHPQRAQGTLMCHIQHRAHSDPFFAPGLQDLTAHVDFTAMADAAFESGLDVLGFTSQARFLLNAGLTDLLLRGEINQNPAQMRKVEMLISEAEMGELFKVLALGRDIDPLLIGFVRGDRRHLL